MAVTRAPWIDVHAHPGRGFLTGLDGSEPLAGRLGGETVAAALAEAAAAGMTAITMSTVADLAVLALDQAKGLVASRPFRPGEAYENHRRQLAGLTALVAAAGADIVTTAAGVQAAQAAGRTAVLLSCEGGDFLEGRLEPLAEARAAGASSLTLVHYRVSEIGDVQTEEPVHHGLSAFGRQVVASAIACA